jgi:hypothetical protein
MLPPPGLETPPHGLETAPPGIETPPPSIKVTPPPNQDTLCNATGKPRRHKRRVGHSEGVNLVLHLVLVLVLHLVLASEETPLLLPHLVLLLPHWRHCNASWEWVLFQF